MGWKIIEIDGKNITFGQFLQKQRRSFGYTQKDIAYYLCVPQSDVSYWEHDVFRPNRFNLSLLDVLLDIGDFGFMLYCEMTKNEEQTNDYRKNFVPLLKEGIKD